jgi:hypothetical protein
MDEILNKLGLKYEDLNKAEKETLNQWMDALQKSSLTIEKIKDAIANMKYAVEQELINEPETRFFFFINRRQILLKARLRNYMLIEALLTSPERAKQAIEQAVLSIKNK